MQTEYHFYIYIYNFTCGVNDFTSKKILVYQKILLLIQADLNFFFHNFPQNSELQIMGETKYHMKLNTLIIQHFYIYVYKKNNELLLPFKLC